MAKIIFIFNDGTGQSMSSPNVSNVVKLYQALPGTKALHSNADEYKVDPENKIHALYFRGIGTKDLRHRDGSKERLNLWEKIVRFFTDKVRTTAELVTGYSIKDRVEQTLAGIEKLWEPGDKIYMVGFSRGAASIRIAASYLGTALAQFKVDYMLVFDTVYSVINEVQIRENMKINRFTDFIIGDHVLRCDHLIAGDEMRDMFSLTPVEKRTGVRQILFAGSHSDVGGGNPSSSLSDVSLTFAIRELKNLGVTFDSEHMSALKLAPDPTAPIEWDRFNGTGQAHFPRALQDIDFVVHDSVFTRANAKKSISIALAQLTTFQSDSSNELVEIDHIKATFTHQPTPVS